MKIDNTRRRLMAHPDTVRARRNLARRACRCQRKGQLGDYFDPNVLADPAADTIGVGSWLSKAFGGIAKIAAPIVGGVVGGPAGAAIGSAAGGLFQGSTSNNTASGTVTNNPLPSPLPTTAGQAFNVNDFFSGAVDLIDAVQGRTRVSVPTSSGQAARLSLSASVAPAAPAPSSQILPGVDNKLLIGGAALVAVVLLARKR